MLKLIKSVTRNVNISIFQNEKGEYWSVEQDLNTGNYVVCQCDEKDIELAQIDSFMSPDLPKVGQNPRVHIFDEKGGDMKIVPKGVLESIFGSDKK